MPTRPASVGALPAAVVQTVSELGNHVAIARHRRKLRQEDLAAKAGISHVTLARIEAGAPGTGIGAYASVLWALGLHHQLAAVARPDLDAEGEALATARLGERVRPSGTLDDNF